MEKEFYAKLLERSEYFLEEARNDFKNEKFDICLFHIEQAAQLFLKAFLLKQIGEFPKTHNLLELVTEVEKLERKITPIKESFRLIINVLIDAYISTRYLPREYTSKECEEAFKFMEELRKCLI